MDSIITEKRRELLDAGGDGQVVLFTSLWSWLSDSTSVVVYSLTVVAPPLLSLQVFPTGALLMSLKFGGGQLPGMFLHLLIILSPL